MAGRNRAEEYDLVVVGAGLAGMAATVFAKNLGLAVAQVGSPGASLFSTGCMDLLGTHSSGEGSGLDDPFKGLDFLREREPDHPYARLDNDEILSAFDEFLSVLDTAGLPFRGYGKKNARVLTPVGTIKPTFRVPESMWNAEYGLQRKPPALLVDFHGLRGYSAAQIAETAASVWPNLTWTRLNFPEAKTDLYPEQMAMAMEDEDVRKAVAADIRTRLDKAVMVGMPAILGLYRTKKVYRDMENLLGVRVFEIPTMPPGVPGLRLKSTLEEHVTGKGVRTFYQAMVRTVRRENGIFVVGIDSDGREETIRSKGAVLATGRFFGRGLHPAREGIREALFDLPVFQPESRAEWHRPDMFHRAGHPVNRAGLLVDERFRPLQEGRARFEHLHAAGSILAHQDWMRQKCGTGLALSTARAAVLRFHEHCCA